MGKKNRNRNKKNKKNSNLISEYLKKLYKNNKLPKVSLCTPTFNRRPFIPMLINCMNRQTYPKKLIEWDKLGFKNIDGSDLPQNNNLEARLVSPDGIEGRMFLVYPNYKNILYYNCSSYYALSIGLLSDEINY